MAVLSLSDFRARFFPAVSDSSWNDWRWQISNRLQTAAQISAVFALSESERAALEKAQNRLAIAITPHYASLMDLADPQDPLRRTHIPVMDEMSCGKGVEEDPLGEESARVGKCLIHRYPDRVLFIVNNMCAGYCRYCNRARLVGRSEQAVQTSAWDEALAYIRQHTEIRDVLISGGDPLMMSDDKIDALLDQVYAIPHVEFVRIGTKLPFTLPQRITPELIAVLKKRRPLWLSLHAIHANEFSPASCAALGRLADAGIIMGSQTVLLKGVNDTAKTMKDLMHALLRNRVTPYALFQFDQIKGGEHFRTSVQKGLEIIENLRGHTTGYAVPSYIIDPPEGGGKVQICPNPVMEREGDYLILKNYEGVAYRYYDPETSD